jgi:hypothetical protein
MLGRLDEVDYETAIDEHRWHHVGGDVPVHTPSTLDRGTAELRISSGRHRSRARD